MQKLCGRRSEDTVRRRPVCTLCLQAERAPGAPADIGLWWEDGWHEAAGGPGWAAVEDAGDNMEVRLWCGQP